MTVPRRLRLANGDWITEPRHPETGDPVCHICGFVFVGSSYGGWETFEATEYGLSTFDICEGCDTEFGIEDHVPSCALPGWCEVIWMRARLDYLHRRGWDQAAIDRIRNGLGITREQLLWCNGALRFPKPPDFVYDLRP